MSFNFRDLLNNDWLKSWRPYFIIFALGFLLYGQTLFFDYTYFDDSTLILEKIEILQNLKNIPTVFSTDAFFSGDRFYYRPLLNLSFMLDAQWGGIIPFFYHFTNILMHCLAVSLLFYILQFLLKKQPLAFFLSLLFLVHPVLTQAVAWLPGRNDSLLAVFVLAAFALFIKFCEQPRLLYYVGYLVFLFMSLLSKESAAVLPLLIIYYFYFIDQNKLAGSDKLLLILGSITTGFIWFLMRHFALGGEPTNILTAISGILHNSPAILVGLGKIILPINLSVLPVLADSTIIYGVIIFMALIYFIFKSREKRWSFLIFGLIWFLLFLLPSFIRLNTLPDFLEHRLYVPLIGFLIIIAEIDYIKNLDFTKKNIKLICLGILVVFMAITLFHSRVFASRLVFWKAAAQSSPHSPLAQRNLGAMYYFEGNYIESEKYYRRALELNPYEEMVHNNLGVIYLDEKKYDLAKNEFLTELKINPGYDKAIINYNRLLILEKKLR